MSPSGGDDDPGGGEPGCGLDATWEQGKQPTKTVHVSTTAMTGDPDGTEAKPFRTIDEALQADGAVVPGTRILLGPGTHAGFEATEVSGTADAPIWLEGSPTNMPTISGGAAGPGLHLIRAKYWVIRNLSFTASNQPGINIDDGGDRDTRNTGYILIDRVRVSPVGNNACIKLSGVTDVTIRDTEAASCARGVMLVGVQRAQLARMNIGGISDVGVSMSAGSADIELRQSVISDVQNRLALWIGGESDIVEFRPELEMLAGNTEARNVRVFDNVIRNVGNVILCSNCRNALVAHNLIRNATGMLLRLHQPYTSLNGGEFEFAAAGEVKLVNNAIECAMTAMAMVSGPDTAPASCTFSHNLWLKGGAAWSPMLPTLETMGIYDRPSGYRDDGKLCASAGGAAASAGIGVMEVEGTMNGACRPMAPMPPSIGPSEPDPGC